MNYKKTKKYCYEGLLMKCWLALYTGKYGGLNKIQEIKRHMCGNIDILVLCKNIMEMSPVKHRCDSCRERLILYKDRQLHRYQRTT